MTNIFYDITIFLKRLIIFKLNIIKDIFNFIIHFNMSNKELINKKRFLSYLLLGIKLITFIPPLVTFAKKSISTFKLKKNIALGSKSSLNNKKGLKFIYILKNLILPSINVLKSWDSKSLDLYYNYNIGLNDITIFPEINYAFEFFDKLLGINLNLNPSVTNNKNIILKNLFLMILEFPLFIKKKKK